MIISAKANEFCTRRSIFVVLFYLYLQHRHQPAGRCLQILKLFCSKAQIDHIDPAILSFYGFFSRITAFEVEFTLAVQHFKIKSFTIDQLRWRDILQGAKNTM